VRAQRNIAPKTQSNLLCPGVSGGEGVIRLLSQFFFIKFFFNFFFGNWDQHPLTRKSQFNKYRAYPLLKTVREADAILGRRVHQHCDQGDCKKTTDQQEGCDS
jgi:hypothetical protein